MAVAATRGDLVRAVTGAQTAGLLRDDARRAALAAVIAKGLLP
jgi:hypothetical protein